jgi:outer membrane protein OmpA-like peptidoglycan-associated protein
MQIDQKPVGAIKVAVERNEAKVLQRLRVFASAAGEDFFYRFPVKTKGGGTDYIEGPSIKCALAVARTYGNCDVDVRTQDTGDAWVFYARFVDFETGFSMTRAFQQRKSQQTMKTDNGRALDIVFQIGQSKAIRNVVCNALGMFTDFAFEEAKGAIVSRVGKNLEQYRTKILARLSEMKIEVRRVETVIGRPADKWLAPDVARIIAEIQAINDGMAAADDLYPASSEAPEKKPERVDFAEPAKAQQQAQPTEEDEREADRLQRAAQEGEQSAAETGEVESDEWDAKLTQMLAEFNGAKNAKEAAAVVATFRDNIVGANERKELSDERAEALMQAWNAATAPKK